MWVIKKQFKFPKKNIDFILLFNNKSKFRNVNLLVVDSNSVDGSKEFLNKVSKTNNFVNVIHKDDLNLVTSRVERIKICRNLCLNYIERNSKTNSVVYIPFDSDFFVFSNTLANSIYLYQK